MELGQRLKQARLEAGLSQRQLCGDVITRNMLSQIENGSARPSMDTLQFLASQLGKSISFFLDGAEASPNQDRIIAARTALQNGNYVQVLNALESYQKPDELLDPEFYLLRCLSLLALAENGTDFHRMRQLLAQAQEAGKHTVYYTPELERRRLLCLARVSPEDIHAILAALDDQELLLRSRMALQNGDVSGCISLLSSARDQESSHWLLLRGDAAIANEDLSAAAAWYHKAEIQSPADAYPRLEQLYLKLEDYKKAYEYACKQRK